MEIPALTEEVLLIIGIAAAVIVLLIILAVVLAVRRRRERARLRERFGPEYDHAVRTEGERRATEDLSGRVEERESFSPVDPGEDTRSGLRRRPERARRPRIPARTSPSCPLGASPGTTTFRTSPAPVTSPGSGSTARPW
jgi:hypothetical protein